MKVPSSIRRRYRGIERQRIVAERDGSFSLGRGRLFRRGRLRVLSVAGDPFEMGYQHGRLLRDEIRQGALPRAATLVKNAIRNRVGDNPLVVEPILAAIRLAVFQPMVRYSIARARELGDEDPFLPAYGLSEGSGVPLDVVLDASVGPDSLMVLATQSATGRGLPRLAGALGHNCSSLMAWGDATVDGRLLVARNTDYPLHGSFDRFPTVVYFAPDDGQRYMSITSAGLHNAGVAGYNESGLFIGSHTVPTTEASPRGVPAFFVAQRALERARTLDEAVASFTRALPPSGWTYEIVSTREKKVTSIELSNERWALRPATGSMHVQTNHYVTEPLTRANLGLCPIGDGDTYARGDRLEKLARARWGELDVPVMMEMLADKEDPTACATRLVGNTVCVHTTLSSMVIDPERGRLWASSGTAPASQGTFVSLPLVDRFDVERFAAEPVETIDNDRFGRAHPRLARAERLFIAAKTAYEQENDEPRALALMRDASKVAPLEAGHRFMKAVLAIKVGRHAEAEQDLERLLDSDRATERHRVLARFLLGRLWAERGDARAQRTLEETLALLDGDPALVRSGQRALSQLQAGRPARLDPRALAVIMQYADLTDA